MPKREKCSKCFNEINQLPTWYYKGLPYHWECYPKEAENHASTG